jgi:DNA-binding response OmpR family regulator
MFHGVLACKGKIMTRKGNILVVDDEPIERQTLSDILRLEGYHVAAVATGEAAVDYVRLNSVDLMLLDLRMPGMNGLDVIKVTNRSAPDVEIILLTAHGSMDSAIEALRSRIQDYLLKPASPALILESVARGLLRRTAKIEAREHQEPAGNDENAILTLEDGTMIDFGRRLVKSGSRTVFLTPAEGRLLKIFAENMGKVFTHRELVLLVQGYSTSQQEAPEILRPLVSRLRQKLSRIPDLLRRIVSVRGTGYVFEKEKS